MNFLARLIVILLLFSNPLVASDSNQYFLDTDKLFTPDRSGLPWYKFGDGKPITMAQWSHLSTQDKIKRLDDGVVYEISVVYEGIAHPELRKAIDKMASQVISEVGTENIESDIDNYDNLGGRYIFSIGEPRPLFINLFKIEQKIVAISVGVYQQGAATFEDKKVDPKKVKSHYKSEAHARASLGDALDLEADVSWQVQSLFEFKGKNFKVLNLDLLGEGFSWTGW